MYDKRYTAIKGSIGVGRKAEREKERERFSGVFWKYRRILSRVYDFRLKFSQEANQQNFGHLKLATQ